MLIRGHESQLYRMGYRAVDGSDDGLTSYHIQIRKPWEDVIDWLNGLGWQPHEPEQNDQLENTVLFATMDRDTALAVAPAKVWDATERFDAGPPISIEEV